MPVTGHQSGIYELGERRSEGDLLLLDGRSTFVLPDGAGGGRMQAASSREGHERLISQGVYHLVTLSGVEALPDGEYLLLEGGSHIYTIWRLDGGLSQSSTPITFRPDLDRVLTQDEVDTLLAQRAYYHS